jgi:uncharacterized membrane protein (DUF4010 family)
VMLGRVLVVSYIFNVEVFKWLLIPCCLMILSSIVVVFFLKKKKTPSSSKDPIQLGNPLDLGNALLFAVQYVVITLIVHYSHQYLGTKGLMLSGLISGLADIDAINISVSKLGTSQITPSLAAIVILLAVISNTCFKIWEAYFRGAPELKKKVLFGLLPSIIVALGSMAGIYLIAGN